jgi:IMP cyclohydrolase
MRLENLETLLRANTYPGRGIVLGRSADNQYAVAAYFIMGRSENSRNRVFVPTEDGIRTEAHDPAKMTDPSLIIYHPVRRFGRGLVVTNGDQTDTIVDFLQRGLPFDQALQTRRFEPDEPNYTPRISGLLSPDGSYKLSILKSADGDPSCCCRHFFTYDAPLAGQGHFIHTYQGDGNPLPSFAGEPVKVALTAPDADTLAQSLWAALNPDNKISLFVRYVSLADGIWTDRIINRYQD